MVPINIIQDIGKDLNLDIGNNISEIIHKEYSYSKKERRSNEIIAEKTDEFLKIANTHISKYFSAYKKFLRNEVINFKKNNNSNNISEIAFFLKKKDELISLMDLDIINKSQFIEYTYDTVYFLELNAIEYPKTVYEALFNYQYYNAILKHKLQQEKKLTKYLLSNSVESINSEVINLYKHKDISIMQIINLVDSTDINAYYVSVKSNKLYMELYEIYIKSEDIILHSINQEVLRLLINKKCFDRNVITSRIDKYVNSKY